VRLYVKRLQDEGMPYYQYIHIRDKFELAAYIKRNDLKSKKK
jgi:hypothetical protein